MKKKNTILFSALVVCCAVGLVSCSDDSPEIKFDGSLAKSFIVPESAEVSALVPQTDDSDDIIKITFRGTEISSGSEQFKALCERFGDTKCPSKLSPEWLWSEDERTFLSEPLQSYTIVTDDDSWINLGVGADISKYVKVTCKTARDFVDSGYQKIINDKILCGDTWKASDGELLLPELRLQMNGWKGCLNIVNHQWCDGHAFKLTLHFANGDMIVKGKIRDHGLVAFD